MNPLFLAIIAFVGVFAVVGGVAMLLSQKPASRIEDRLDLLTGANTPATAKDGLMKQSSVLARPLDQGPALLDSLLKRFGDFNLNLLFEQADVPMTTSGLAVASAILALVGGAAGYVLGQRSPARRRRRLPLGGLPIVWVWFRRKKRLKLFGAQLPDAMEMLSRALRAGQSLGFGFNMVGSEMSGAHRQGIQPRLRGAEPRHPHGRKPGKHGARIPNLDPASSSPPSSCSGRRAATSPKSSTRSATLIRDRFRIWGQIQALTGEGRLSGVVLLALPLGPVHRRLPAQSQVRFAAVYRSAGQEDAGRRRGDAIGGGPGHPQDHRHQGVTKPWSSPIPC